MLGIQIIAHTMLSPSPGRAMMGAHTTGVKVESVEVFSLSFFFWVRVSVRA